MRKFFIIRHPTLGVFKGNSWLPDVANFVIKSTPVDTHNIHAGHYGSQEMAHEIALRYSGYPDPKRVHELKYPPRVTHDQLRIMGAAQIFEVSVEGSVDPEYVETFVAPALNNDATSMKTILDRLSQVDEYFGLDKNKLQDIAEDLISANE